MMIARWYYILCLFTVLFSSMNAQTMLTQTIVWDGNDREFVMYIPSGYDGSSTPLLFNFHGGGDYALPWMSTVDMRTIAEAANFILVYPQAFPDPTDGGSTNWIRKQPTTFDDVPFVEAMIDVISSEYSIDSKRVYACGYSLGGEFTFELACRLSHKIAAIGVVARTMYIETFNNCAPVHQTGVITILGTDDFISNYDGITFQGIQYYLSADETHDYWVDHNNTLETAMVSTIPNTNTSDGSTVERYTWSDAETCAYIEHLKVIGGGHDWPGDFGNMDIDASQEIWDFVSRYDLDGLIACSTSSQNEINGFSESYKAYPNPLNNQLFVETDYPIHESFEIYNQFGELVMQGHLDTILNTIDISRLLPSVYILKIGDHATKLIKI